VAKQTQCELLSTRPSTLHIKASPGNRPVSATHELRPGAGPAPPPGCWPSSLSLDDKGRARLGFCAPLARPAAC